VPQGLDASKVLRLLLRLLLLLLTLLLAGWQVLELWQLQAGRLKGCGCLTHGPACSPTNHT
jgi:hypothetical protein